MPTKPRSDSKLKSLPFAQQEEIYALCQTMSYAAVRSAIKSKFKIETSESALSAFWAWYPTKRRLEDAASTANEVKTILKELPGLSLSDEQVSRAAQAAFEAQALKAGDIDSFVALRKLRLKDASNVLVSRRIALLEDNARRAKAALEGIKTKGGLTPETLKAIEEAAGLL